MAHCIRCNRYMLFKSTTGYCKECIAHIIRKEEECKENKEAQGFQANVCQKDKIANEVQCSIKENEILQEGRVEQISGSIETKMNDKAQKAIMADKKVFLSYYLRMKQLIGTANISYAELEELVKEELSVVGLSKEELNLIDYDSFIKAYIDDDNSAEDTWIAKQNKRRILAMIHKRHQINPEADCIDKTATDNCDSRAIIEQYIYNDKNEIPEKEIIQALQNENHNIDEIWAMDNQSKSLLSVAIQKSNFEVFDYLLVHNCDVNIELHLIDSKYGKCYECPLSLAIAKNNLEMVDKLLLHGANPNAMCQYGQNKYTILNIAVFLSNAEIVSALLRSGANPNIESIEMNGRFCPLHSAVIKHKYDVIKLLINAGADVNYVIHSEAADYTVLNWAIVMNDLEAFNILMDANANPNCIRVSHIGQGDNPALADAVFREKYEMVKRLIQAGADLNCYAFNKGRKSTCIDIAFANYDMEMVRILQTARINAGYDNSQSEVNKITMNYVKTLQKTEELLSENANSQYEAE